jgi:aminopeptidase-like protein
MKPDAGLPALPTVAYCLGDDRETNTSTSASRDDSIDKYVVSNTCSCSKKNIKLSMGLTN